MHAPLGALLNPRGVAGSHGSLATPAIDVLPAISAQGRQLTIRAVTPTDTPVLTELIASLSERSRQLRFLRSITSMDQIRREAARVAERTPQQGLALVVIACASDHERAIALGELVVDSAAPNVGEVAVLVGDPYQREGIGRMLTAILIELAALREIEALRATAAAEPRSDVPGPRYTAASCWSPPGSTRSLDRSQ